MTEGKKSKALNIVIKLATINGRPCIKISDGASPLLSHLSVCPSG